MQDMPRTRGAGVSSNMFLLKEARENNESCNIN